MTSPTLDTPAAEKPFSPVAKPRSEGAVVAGNGTFIFNLEKMAGMDAGKGYSTAFGPVLEGCGI